MESDVQRIAELVKVEITKRAMLKRIFVELYLIGNNSKNRRSFEDIDLVLIVTANSNLIDILVPISEIVDQLIRTRGVFISIFPIMRQDFLSNNTMFIKNVKNNGTKI